MASIRAREKSPQFTSNEPLNENKLLEFTCHRCSKVFKDKHHFKYHACLMSTAMVTETKKLFIMTCSKCTKTFKRKDLFQHHACFHAAEDYPFRCSECGKTFSSKQAAEKHSIVHTKVSNFMCELCDHAAHSQAKLIIHQRMKHTGERPFKCPECDSAFPTEGFLKRHVLTHGETKNFQCALCDFGAHTKAYLLRHMKQRHTNERPVRCPHCPQSFLTQSDLKPHLSCHVTEKTIICKVCNSKFKAQRYLRKHERQFHPEAQT